MARPSVLMCDPFGISLAIATRPEQQTKEVHAYLTDWAAGHIWDALHAG